MANEIVFPSTVHADSLYAIVYNTIGQPWYKTTPAFEAYSTAHLSNYTTLLGELGTASQMYTATFPSGIAAGTYYVFIYRYVSAAAEGDVCVGVGKYEWDGSAVVSLYSRLAPTTAGRTLDVSTGGEAGLDWANVGSPTTSLALTGTTIAVTQKVDVDTIKTNPVANGGTVTFPTNATLASTTNITAAAGCAVSSIGSNVITAASIAADAITAAKIADGAIDSATFASGTTIPRCTLTDTLTTYTGNTVQTGDSYARIGAAGTGLTAITNKTDNLPSDPADESLIIAATDAIMYRIGAPVGASISADIAEVEGHVAGLTFTVPNVVDSNARWINGIQLQGAGTSGNPMRPA